MHSVTEAYSGCVRCTLWSLNRTLGALPPVVAAAPPPLPRVFLVSDDPATVALGHHLPVGVLSTPLLDEVLAATPTFHLDIPSTLNLSVFDGNSTLHPSTYPALVAAAGSPPHSALHSAQAAFVAAFVDLVALSAVDVLVYTKSGFSKSAAEWGGVHVNNIRMLPRAPKADAFIEVLSACGPGSFQPLYYKLAW